MKPEEWVPRPYQKVAVKECIKNACMGLLLDPGLGKTTIMMMAFKLLKAKGLVDRMLVVAPLRPMQVVWTGERDKWANFNDLKIEILHGPDKERALRRKADLHVINPEGLPWLLGQRDELRRLQPGAAERAGVWWDILTVDECFPAGTPVLTRQGPRNIEIIKEYDEVLTSTGWRSVLKCGTRTVNRLVRLTLSDGAALECTPEHPVFTDLGWVPARIAKGRTVYDPSDVSDMHESVQKLLSDDPARWKSEMLLSILRSEMDVATHEFGQTPDHFCEDIKNLHRSSFVEQRPLVVSGASQEDVESSESTRPDVQSTGWQRDRPDVLRNEGSLDSAEDVAVELFDRIGEEALALSYLLQVGFCASNEKDRIGNRRRESSTSPTQVSRSQKREAIGPTWVESVESIERPGTIVYNLRVESCPHFFAGGVLVHNSTQFKHTDTKRFKILKPHLDKFRRRYILTGSPAPNGLLDLFGQIFILDLGSTLGKHITYYRVCYFNATGFGNFTWIPQRGAEERIYKKLKPLVVRMAAKDHIQLPELVMNTVEVELPPKARKVYDEMERMMIADIEEGRIIAANAAAATGKCRQIANGGIYHMGGKEWTSLHEEKLDAVEEIIEELSGKPVLVAYEYEHDLNRLRRRLGSGVPHIGGGVSAANFRRIESEWNQGKLPILLAQPQSVAHGLNLQGTGAAVIFHSITWNLEDYEQLIRRIWRQGQQERVVVHHIVARGTVDEAIMTLLKKKDRTQRALLDALTTYVRKSA